MTITIIGAGGVATNIGRLLRSKSNVHIAQLLGRSENSTKALADSLQCTYILHPDQLNQVSDLYIIAVQDREIPTLIAQLSIPTEAVIVHTAGGVSIDVFKGLFTNYGVLYPLQSLRKETSILPKIPFYLDGNTLATKSFLTKFSKQTDLDYKWANDQQRMQLHIAAVFCSNFPNYLYALAAAFCKAHQLEFSSLLPVIEETSNRLAREGLSPATLQTGPAIRKDMVTTDMHEAVLKTDKEAEAVYQYLTGQIMKSDIFSS